VQEGATFPRPEKTMTDTPLTPPAAASAEFAGEDRTVSLPILVVFAFLIGVVAAVGAVVFRYMIGIIHNVLFLGTFSFVYDANQFDPPSAWGPFVILVPVIGGLVVVWLVKTFAPEAKGHGVPEVMFAIYHNKGNVRGVVAVIKSLASALSIGTGASVGREGPIIQIGASFGSTLARMLHLARWQKITMIAAGAGAGIAATFNTPLGGVLFAVELLLPELSNRTFLPVVVATTTATSIARYVFGLSPAFYVPEAALPNNLLTITNPAVLAGFTLLGLAAGVASWAFIRFLAWCEDIFPKLPGNAYTQNIIGMLIIGVLFYAFEMTTGQPHTAGVGYATIQSILNGGTVGLVLLSLLFLAKIFATSISLGSGASGGIFSPSLFIGATLGAAFGSLGAALFPAAGFSVIEFAVVGMGALVGGGTGASMTAIVMIFEMTRDYNVIVPLVLAVALATGTRRALITENIYTIKLRHRGKPIPVNRHTNMYLVRQARELMNKDFTVLPITTPIAEALAKLADRPTAHIIVSDGPRIAGVARLAAGSYAPDRYAGQTLESITADNYVISQDTAILNTVISRMNRRSRNFCIVVSDRVRIPRAEDVVGVIAASEIANAVISNHYA
jgi:chloride channel protein, CIC family